MLSSANPPTPYPPHTPPAPAPPLHASSRQFCTFFVCGVLLFYSRFSAHLDLIGQDTPSKQTQKTQNPTPKKQNCRYKACIGRPAEAGVG